ncbi:DUF2934 domain-containing protein [Mesorhizobium plurifarium]|uniref:DUF2934 domain-containing protein n=1 Tax=Sinorhizobium arboris TaxID=76745 RepID=UPI0003F62FD8|nr:DUF2934 domain-containing protein [Sinorhizobium arboris]PST24023.1 DUF2934 domain-containing protein [Mesorhizobium plurifarium]
MDEIRDRDSEREELIRRRAYAIWEQEGRPDGQHQRHWEQAAREMQGQSDGQTNGQTNGSKREKQTAAETEAVASPEADSAARPGSER